MKLCSACLLGTKCKHDGSSALNEKVVALSKKEVLIPVCPEQLGGLSTPRESSEIRDGRVFTKSGKDVTEIFVSGAEETLVLAKKLGIKEAILKQKSPSCGCGKIYDGTFSNKLIKGDGVTTTLLKKKGIKVVSEEDV